jgi:hypothetical protein
MTLPTTGLFRFALAFAATSTFFAIIPAFADGPRPVSVEFTYDPDASAATNYRNLVVKVKRACTQQGPRSIAYMPKEKACIAGMTNLVVAQLDKPEVHVAHAAATGAGRRELAAQ